MSRNEVHLARSGKRVFWSSCGDCRYVDIHMIGQVDPPNQPIPLHINGGVDGDRSQSTHQSHSLRSEGVCSDRPCRT